MACVFESNTILQPRILKFKTKLELLPAPGLASAGLCPRIRQRGLTWLCGYCATKTAIIGFKKALRATTAMKALASTALVQDTLTRVRILKVRPCL